MALSGTFESMKAGISPALVHITRTAGRIAAEDLAFQRSINPAVTPKLDKQNRRLLHIVNGLGKNATIGTELTAPQLSDADSVEERWQGLVDVLDSLLEKADACLDEYTGIIKKSNVSGEASSIGNALPSRKPYLAQSYRAQTLPKPQLLFQRPPMNDDTTPFKPLLHSKPHAIIPLEESLRLEAVGEGLNQYGHPYGAEIKASKYPDRVYQVSPPIHFLPLNSTEATFVDSMEEVKLMLQELRNAEEIAVDLEHHDAHSYIGLTSLMQISTRDKDWIVDTLQPWREELQILNEIFANPRILKIFHGAFMDMIWLQRDLGLYVVGLFDTYHASKALGYPKNSLAALLSRHANFDAAKQYQMADWRIRPLPTEMFEYARADTHFLLYVYDKLRNELLEKSDSSKLDGDLIGRVLSKSKDEALQRYERPSYDAQKGTGSTGWFNLLQSNPTLFSREQFAVFRAVHQWRDSIARKEDESVHVIMPKYVLFNIAREMPLDLPKLLGCSHPISTAVQGRTAELLEIIRRAKVEGTTGLDLNETMQNIQPARPRPETTSAPNLETTLTVPGRTPTSEVVPDADMQPRALHSLFWGPTINSEPSQRTTTQAASPLEELRLALPMPQLTAEVYADPDTGMNASVDVVRPASGAQAEHSYVKDRGSTKEDVFIVRNIGGPKKRKTASLDEGPEPLSPDKGQQGPADSGDKQDPNEGNLTIKTAEQQAAYDKAARKADRKVQKRNEKQRRQQEEQQRLNGYTVSREEDGDEPFDYENAPSVLHARGDEDEVPGSTKRFNPYLKSLDAPKGLRRVRTETAGKSFTFKS